MSNRYFVLGRCDWRRGQYDGVGGVTATVRMRPEARELIGDVEMIAMASMSVVALPGRFGVYSSGVESDT